MMKLSRCCYLLLIPLAIVFFTCRPAYTLTGGKPETEIIYPVSDFDLPSLSFDLYLPPSPLAQIENVPFAVSITEDFCARDKNHIAASDPLLFCHCDTMIIDLLRVGQSNYSFPLPGAKVISPYAGKRKNHSGIDLKTSANDTIRAAFDGIVRMAKSYYAYGNVIVVRHFNGLETVYSHNSKHLVKAGDRVVAGQPVALVGRTGRATTEHLHFETRINGQHFNPELLFDMQSGALKDQALLCIKENSRIKVLTTIPLFRYLFTATP